ncbi:MAG TPA: hypothetical protein VGB59_07715 [Allosphingosinicella sp.]|jgi:hypothetical protein
MGDHDRDRDYVRETDRTTIVHADGGERRGGGGLVIGLVLLLALLALLFFLFGGSFNRTGDKVGVEVDVDAPKVEVPNVNVKVPDEIKVDVPDVEVKTDGNSSR